jgi:hypothetical protein
MSTLTFDWALESIGHVQQTGQFAKHMFMRRGHNPWMHCYALTMLSPSMNHTDNALLLVLLIVVG